MTMGFKYKKWRKITAARTCFFGLICGALVVTWLLHMSHSTSESPIKLPSNHITPAVHRVDAPALHRVSTPTLQHENPPALDGHVHRVSSTSLPRTNPPTLHRVDLNQEAMPETRGPSTDTPEAHTEIPTVTQPEPAHVAAPLEVLGCSLLFVHVHLVLSRTQVVPHLGVPTMTVAMMMIAPVMVSITHPYPYP